jgi:hypothetical protein
MGADYFCDLYARDADPWKFASSDYARHKYGATLNALPIGSLCTRARSGVFDRRFHEHARATMWESCCDRPRRTRVGSASSSPPPSPAKEAGLRCASHRNIAFATMQAPGEWPAGRFDLIVLSEVLYFFGRTLIGQLAERVEGSLRNPSHVLLVHWLGETDYPLSGDDAVTEFVARTGSFLRIICQQRTAEYRLDLLGPITAPFAISAA